MPIDFSALEYWNERYRVKYHDDADYTYDWYFNFSQIYHAVGDALVKGNVRILIAGCGASNFALELYKVGFTSIVNVDFSPVLIENLIRQYGDMEGMECQ